MTVLKEQESKHVAESDALREQFKNSSEASMEMISKQAQEISALRVLYWLIVLKRFVEIYVLRQNKISTVEGVNASMSLEMQKKYICYRFLNFLCLIFYFWCEQVAAEARQEERGRNNASISDLRQRFDAE